MQVVRTTNLSNGADAQQGYFVGLDSGNGSLFLGKENYSWTSLTGILLPGGVALNTHYHMVIQVTGCTNPTQTYGGDTGLFTYTDNCFPSGKVGQLDCQYRDMAEHQCNQQLTISTWLTTNATYMTTHVVMSLVDGHWDMSCTPKLDFPTVQQGSECTTRAVAHLGATS
jgi:hypothetical protein